MHCHLLPMCWRGWFQKLPTYTLQVKFTTGFTNVKHKHPAREICFSTILDKLWSKRAFKIPQMRDLTNVKQSWFLFDHMSFLHSVIVVCSDLLTIGWICLYMFVYIGCIFHKNFTVVNGTPVHMCYCEKQHGIVHSGHHNNQLLHGILLVTLLD